MTFGTENKYHFEKAWVVSWVDGLPAVASVNSVASIISKTDSWKNRWPSRFSLHLSFFGICYSQVELSPTISFRYLDIGSVSMSFLEQDEDSIVYIFFRSIGMFMTIWRSVPSFSSSFVEDSFFYFFFIASTRTLGHLCRTRTCTRLVVEELLIQFLEAGLKRWFNFHNLYQKSMVAQLSWN